MKKLKDLCLSVLINEGEEVISISPEEIGKVLDVNFDSEDIRIDFETSYGKKLSFIIKTNDFKKWLELNKGKFKDVFKYFIIDFFKDSEVEENINEIVDDNGDIMSDDDMPNNSSNTMVTSPKFDLEKIFKSLLPKNTRFYNSTWGYGGITW